MSSDKSHVLFGYGSLINDESRARSFNSKKCYGANLLNHQRAWCVPVPDAEVTALGLLPHTGASCNGVLIEISDSEIAQADARENPSGYERISLPWENVMWEAGSNLAEAEAAEWRTLPLWIYCAAHNQPPSDDRPIIQSYVDVVLLGVLKRGIRFAENFVLSTQGWDAPWIDDRQAPRYVRALKSTAAFADIDNLLMRLVPEAVAHRRRS